MTAPRLTDNRSHYAPDAYGERCYQRDLRTYAALDLAAYRTCLAAYRAKDAALVIREQYPYSDEAQHAYIEALAYYTYTINELPSWCIPPSYIAEGM